MASSGDLRAAAAQFTAAAAALPGALQFVTEASGPSTWRGPAARRFADGLDDCQRQLRAVAEELEVAARQCGMQAAALDAVPPVPADAVTTGSFVQIVTPARVA